MPKTIAVSSLATEPLRSIILRYAEKIPNGQAVALPDAAEDLGMNVEAMRKASAEAGVKISAFTGGGQIGATRKAYIVNPQTAQSWRASRSKK